METATQDQTKSASPNAGVPAPNDPENDIDAKSLTLWVLSGTIVLFIALWMMLPIFVRVQEAERLKKVDSTPNTEFEQAREAQTQFLNGANPTKKTLDQALTEALKK